jgi:hypothetical protein
MAMVDKANWQSAADRLSRDMLGRPARLEVASEAIGDQVEAEWASLIGVTYDPKDDNFNIQLEGVDHMVRRPRSFAVRESGGLADSLAVVDGEGTEHILQLQHPVRLGPAA